MSLDLHNFPCLVRTSAALGVDTFNNQSSRMWLGDGYHIGRGNYNIRACPLCGYKCNRPNSNLGTERLCNLFHNNVLIS